MAGAEDLAGESVRPERSSRWRRRLAIVGVVLVVLAVALRVALPYALERAVPIGAERFGFAASVANVDFALLRGHVVVEGLRVAPLATTSAGAAAPDLLGLGRLFVNVEWLRLLRGELEVAELLLEKPVLSLVRAADGYIELPALPPSTEPKQKEPEAEEPSEPMPITLKSLAIRDTELHLVDGAGGANLMDFALKELGFSDLRLVGAKVGLGGIRISEPNLRVRREVQSTKAGARGGAAPPPPAAAETAGAPPELRIDDLEIERAEFSVLTDGEPVSIALRLKTTGVSLAPDAPFPLEFGLEAGEGSVTLKGQLGLNPLVWDGKVAWQGMTVPMFVRAALPELIPWIESCSASGDLDVTYRVAGLRASGQLGVDDFAFQDPQQELALGWKSLAIELKQASVPLEGGAEPIRVALGKIALDAPQARYVLPNTAIERLIASAGGAPAEPAAEAPAAAPAEAAAEGAARPEPRITVDQIEIRRGGAEFVDRSGKEPYQGRVRDLSVDVAGVALPERTVQSVRVRGIAPERAPFDLRASLPGARGTMSFKLERLPLAQFTPYSASAADLRIPKGELSLDTKATLTKSGAAGQVQTQVVVHELSIQGGPNAISVAGMPLDLALALLRDPEGDIALPIPLEYGEQGASAGIGTILLGALRAAITGAVTSPIKAMGVLLPEGGKAEISFAPIAFAAGDATAPPDAAEQLAPLAKLLAQRPGLGLALVGHAGSDDRLALAERILIERVAADRGLPALDDAGFFARRRVQGALGERGRGEAGALEPEDQALLARYLEATDVPAERYTDLARRRAEAVRDVLATAHTLAPARLLVEAGSEAAAPEVVPELRVSAGG
jgi:outer membrane protein OmpA-like peptidoglycan-associated protein